MPYPPQPYPPLPKSGPPGYADAHRADIGVYIKATEAENTVPDVMVIDSPDSTLCDEKAEMKTDNDEPAAAGDPAVVHGTLDSTVEDSECHLVSPGFNGHAYTQPLIPLGVTTAVATPVENHCVSARVPARDPLMEAENNRAILHSELSTGFGHGCDGIPRTLAEAAPHLLYAAAFSHLSCSPHASPLVASSNASTGSQVHAPPGRDTAVFCADGISDETNNFPVSTNPVSAAFARSISPLPPSSPGFIDDYPVECSDDVSVVLFPLPCSPVPSSSPPNFFTSSPTHGSLNTSLPTSPVPTERLNSASLTVHANPLKRPRSPNTVKNPTDDLGVRLEEGPMKKKRPSTREPPQPKRSTHLSQRREHAKLKTPFRSPVTAATKDCPRYKDTAPTSEPDFPSSPAPSSQGRMVIKNSLPEEPQEDLMTRVRTPRASAQFKSPLSAGPGVGNSRRAVSASPNVQALQLRLQTLKRATKIKTDEEGEKLEKLAKKWTDVAREVAWEVWSVVKDNVQDVSKFSGGRGGFQDSWGWTDDGKEDSVAKTDRPSGETEVLSEEDESPVSEDTMSTMLRKMGIDPDTLGWNEGEGEFMDVSW